jgi:hypothetical protein
MMSVIHSEVIDRLALHYPGTGLVQTVEQMVTGGDRVEADYHDKTVWKNDHWSATIDGETKNLNELFRTGLFERYKPYREQDEAIELLLSGSGDDSPDGFFPVRNRFGSAIPLEYIWGVRDELASFLENPDPVTQQAIETADDPATIIELDETVLPYIYQDHTHPSSDRERIQEQDIEALCEKLCAATEHVERSIRYKNAFLNKERLPVDLPTFGIPDTSLTEACQEYISRTGNDRARVPRSLHGSPA